MPNKDHPTPAWNIYTQFDANINIATIKSIANGTPDNIAWRLVRSFDIIPSADNSLTNAVIFVLYEVSTVSKNHAAIEWVERELENGLNLSTRSSLLPLLILLSKYMKLDPINIYKRTIINVTNIDTVNPDQLLSLSDG